MGDEAAPVIVVSGLPRSGTSAMMQMLAAGGVEVLTDGKRAADDDNPRGYLEDERVKGLEKDASWLYACRGKAVKIIATLLRHLPSDLDFRIIFMNRDLDKVLRSQRAMMKRRGEADTGPDDAQMRRHFERHLERVRANLAAASNIRVLEVDYGELVTSPAAKVEAVRDFLGMDLNVEAMASAVDSSLHRQRS